MRRSKKTLQCSMAAALLLIAASFSARADDPPAAPPPATPPAAAQQAEPGEPAEPAEPGAPTVGSSLDRTEAHVGDRLTLTVSAVARDALAPTVHLGKLDLGKFEILDQSDTTLDLGDGKKSRRFVLQVAAYELGDLEIPPIAVEYRSEGGEARKVRTAAIPVHIRRIVDDPKAEMQPLARTRELLVEDRRYLEGLWAAGAAFVLLVLGLIARSLLRRRRFRPVVVPPRVVRPPHEVALERLREIRQRNRFELDAWRPFHFAVSEVIREYLGARFGFDSLELTTTELRDELARLTRPIAPTAPRAVEGASQAGAQPSPPPPRPAPLPEEKLPPILSFLDECDLVKFAKAPSSDESALRLLAEAEAIVRATMGSQAPAEDEHPAARAAGAGHG